MSIEVELGRIATALEKQNALTEALVGKPASAAPVVAAPNTEKKAPKNAPVVAAEVKVDPFADAEAPKDELTIDILKDLLTTHAKAFGTKVTVELIKKHGADAATPKITTIPQANWKACFDEATADLKKVK